jgi:hypothetical protein
MTKRIPNGGLMINRSLALLAAALGALALGLASTPTVGGLVGVDVARAQSPASSAGTAATDPDPDAPLDDTATGTLDQSGLGGPVDDQPATGTGSGTGTATGTGSAPAAPPDPDAGLDDTPAGCLDQGGLGGPIDDTGTAADPGAGTGTCAATGTDPGTGSSSDPDAGLDDTPVGGLDDTDLGGPIDATDQPAADPPPTTTPDPTPGSDGATPPPAGTAPSPASGTSPAPIYVIVNVPSSTPVANGRQAPPKPKSSKKKHKTAKKKHKSSKQSKRRSSHTHSQRRSHEQTTSGRVGLELRRRPFPPRRAPAGRVTRRRSTRG